MVLQSRRDDNLSYMSTCYDNDNELFQNSSNNFIWRLQMMNVEHQGRLSSIP